MAFQSVCCTWAETRPEGHVLGMEMEMFMENTHSQLREGRTATGCSQVALLPRESRPPGRGQTQARQVDGFSSQDRLSHRLYPTLVAEMRRSQRFPNRMDTAAAGWDNPCACVWGEAGHRGLILSFPSAPEEAWCHRPLLHTQGFRGIHTMALSWLGPTLACCRRG